MSNSTCSGVDASHSGIALVCFELPRAPLTCTSTYGNDCIVTGYSCGLVQTGDHVGCGPLPQRTDACCWEVLGGCAVGRPFTVAGKARVASVESTSEWASEITPSLDGLDEATRHALAQVWTDEGCSEHASVASFARSVLELCALGAPAHLIAGALRAGRDEIEHARVAFGLASRYAGRPIGPGCLDVSRALDASSLPEVAVRTAAEGCVAETVSAMLIGAASDAATEPTIRAHLARVAKEESEHAVLAWRQLAWLLERGDRALRDRIARVFEEAERHVGIGPVAAAVADAASLRAHGQLPADERRRAARTALAEIVRPAAAQLWLSVSGSGHDTAASTRVAS